MKGSHWAVVVEYYSTTTATTPTAWVGVCLRWSYQHTFYTRPVRCHRPPPQAGGTAVGPFLFRSGVKCVFARPVGDHRRHTPRCLASKPSQNSYHRFFLYTINKPVMPPLSRSRSQNLVGGKSKSRCKLRGVRQTGPKNTSGVRPCKKKSGPAKKSRRRTQSKSRSRSSRSRSRRSKSKSRSRSTHKAPERQFICLYRNCHSSKVTVNAADICSKRMKNGAYQLVGNCPDCEGKVFKFAKASVGETYPGC